MTRSATGRSVALVCFLLAGSLGPAWELAHALVHRHGLDAGTERPAVASPADRSAGALGPDHGHEHPVLQPAARPPGSPSAIDSALPATSPRIVLGSAPVLVAAPPATEARAGPGPGHSSRSRAPPLP